MECLYLIFMIVVIQETSELNPDILKYDEWIKDAEIRVKKIKADEKRHVEYEKDTGSSIPNKRETDNDGEEIKVSEDLNEEDQRRLERLKFTDLSAKGLRFSLLINKTKELEIEPKVYEYMKNATKGIKNVRNELILLRDEIGACGNVSNINKCNAWKKVFNSCLGNLETELFAIRSLSKVIKIRAEMIKNLKYEVRIQKMDVAILKKAVGELSYAKRLLARGDYSSECRRTMEKVPDALMKFGRTLVFARHFIQMHINRLEKQEGIIERLISDTSPV